MKRLVTEGSKTQKNTELSASNAAFYVISNKKSREQKNVELFCLLPLPWRAG